jgi:hypothetical protein
MEVLLRFAFLTATKSSSCIKVAQAGVLLTAKKTSVEYTVIISDLPVLTHFELLCYTCFCWCQPSLTWVTARNTMIKWSRIAAEQMFFTRLVQKYSSVSTVPHLVTEITCVYGKTAV